MTSNLVTRYLVIGAVMALALTCMALNWPVKLGIDLRGGSILTYQVTELTNNADDQADTDALGFSREDVDETVGVIAQRINSQGLDDIQVRRVGDNYIELVCRDVSKSETDEIRRKMTQVGRLEFPIEAQSGDKAGRVSFNEQQLTARREAALKAGKIFQSPPGFKFYPKRPAQKEKQSDEDYRAEMETYNAQLVAEPWAVTGAWMFFDPDFWGGDLDGFTGKMIKSVKTSFDKNGMRAVSYNVDEAYQTEFAAYTSKFMERGMAVVLNGEIWSLANINGVLKDNVEITKGGTGYTEAEQAWLINCLKSGSLKLKPTLISQDEISATLGHKAINRGMIAFIIGMAAVVFMMLFYYRISGVFAVIALTVNFVLIFGILMLLEAALTLPGIAGLVLTVGMAVDANILIFERIREELSKGKTVLQASKNGFDRAFVTIFDANLTTFIVAAFLVYYGQGPIKGFGYTLMVGIVCSMFSALYITRTLMGMALKAGWLKDIKYGALLTSSKYNFQAMFKKAAVLSIVLVVLGVTMFVAGGDKKYGLDFTGGTSVRMAFKEPMAEGEVRDAIKKITDASGKSRYQKIEVAMISPEGGKSKDIKVVLDYVAPSDSSETQEGEDGQDEYDRIQRELETVLAGKLIADSLVDRNYDNTSQSWSATLNLVTRAEQKDIDTALAATGLDKRNASSDSEGKVWRVSGVINANGAPSVPESFLKGIREIGGIEVSSPFEGTRFVGPRVVSDLKSSAIQAMVASLLFILAYIWFRFKELKFGFAAAVALIHDVFIAMGVTVAANAIGIIHVPISLNVVAAFLTIIGYSLNDTIVVFDRIRENRDNMKGTFGDVVNRSINQTLSRTILTSLTTGFVVLAVLLCNLGIESPLEGFAFTLLIGVVVGTYSSMFVASPLLIWAHNREQKGSKKVAKAAVAAS
ncbi:MAG: protein translocase subunit SecD [Planctomycetota bacterium]